MPFPIIRNQIVTNGTTGGTSVSVNLPSGIVAGEWLVILHRCAGAGALALTGWTELKDGSPDGDDDQSGLFVRLADGTEGASVTITQANDKFASCAWRISGGNPNITPEVTTDAIGASTTPNPGASTPTGGAKDYLFLALFTQGGENTFTSHPTNYTLGQINANSGTGGATTTNCRSGGSGRQINGSSEDPGNFTTAAAAEDWTGWTLAIHPGAILDEDVPVVLRQEQFEAVTVFG